MLVRNYISICTHTNETHIYVYAHVPIMPERYKTLRIKVDTYEHLISIRNHLEKQLSDAEIGKLRRLKDGHVISLDTVIWALCRQHFKYFKDSNLRIIEKNELMRRGH